VRGEDERPDAWDVALRLLAMRARTTQDVAARLARRGYTPAEIEPVLRRLTAARYLDDAGFARSWARSPAHRGFGPGRIARELRARGVPESEVSAVLGELADERDIRGEAQAVAAKKLHALRGLPPAVVRRRLAAHLARRGFTTDVVLELLRRLPGGDE